MLPAPTAFAIPFVPITATSSLLLDQMPPSVVLVIGVVFAIHTVPDPVIVPAAGCGFTVIIAVARSVPQLLVTE